MTTYRKAFEQFQAKLAECKNGEEDQADVLAMFALSKQIPISLPMPKDKSRGTKCKCGKDVFVFELYCPFCGQSLFWSES